MNTSITRKLSSLLLLSAIALGVSSAAPGHARADWVSCDADEVAEISSRIHVRCKTDVTVGTAKIRFIAISNSNAGTAARFVAVGNAAVLSGKTFRADIPSASTTNVSGCSSTNCRTPTGWAVQD